jgi:hypothetical protein
VTGRCHLHNRNPGARPRVEDVAPARARAAILVLLSIAASARVASPADGAAPPRALSAAAREPGDRFSAPDDVSLRLEEPGRLVPAGSTLRRTVALAGLGTGSDPVEVDWEARLNGALAAGGREVAESRGGASRIALSVPLPALDEPAGLDLKVEARTSGAFAGEASFAFLVYPGETGRSLADLFGKARVALYDPEGGAAPALAALGLHPEEFSVFEGLALYRGDLIVIGPGGFSRGREALGPILAARARSGMRMLLLEQPTLPGTLSEDLRLWPSFSSTPEAAALVAPEHPVLRGLTPDGAADFLAARRQTVRPLLPPTRGNFRIISELRARTGPAWQEGVTLLELAIGSGTVLAAQSSLCADFARLPQARLVLANALAYLLGERRGLKRAFVYGATVEDLPACLARLAPGAFRLPAGLAGVEILLVAGDWRAPRLAAASGLPPIADVARYLREGGSVLLLNPQPLSLPYIEAVVGAPVYFEPAGEAGPQPPPMSPLFDGIALDDLALMARAMPSGFRLRSLPGLLEVEPLVITPGIVQYRVGRGSLVALSLPDANDCAAPRASSLLARLLTNLGVPLEDRPGIDPSNVSLLDE